jgi:hypothetical protein
VKIEIGPLIITSGKYKISLSTMTGNTRSDTWDSAIGFTLVECQPFAKSWEIPAYREGACILGQSFSEAK